jgi:hypothetical protein
MREVKKEFEANQRPCLRCWKYLARSSGCNYMDCPCGHPFCFECGQEMPKDSKKMCAEHHNCDSADYELKVITKRLNTKTISLSSGRDEIVVTIDLLDDRRFAMKIRPTASVGELKAKINQLTSIQVDTMYLTINGHPANASNMSVSELGLRMNGTVVLAIVVLGGSLMQLVI